MKSKVTDCSLDLETLHTSPRALILSIGVTLFDRETGEITLSLQYFVTPWSQLFRRKISWDTVNWWLSQDNDARDALGKGIKTSGEPLKKVLKKLSLTLKATENADELLVWGNGASFDNAIMEDAYNQCRLPLPWKFWNNQCLRTLLKQVEDRTGRRLKKEIPFSGTKHDALADSRYQALLTIKGVSALKESK